MDSTKTYDSTQLFSTMKRCQRLNQKLQLEMAHNIYIPILTDVDLDFACRACAQYHNDLCRQYDDDGWDEETAQMFTRTEEFMLEPDSEDEDEWDLKEDCESIY